MTETVMCIMLCYFLTVFDLLCHHENISDEKNDDNYGDFAYMEMEMLVRVQTCK